MEGVKWGVLPIILILLLIESAHAGSTWYGPDLPGTPLENFVKSPPYFLYRAKISDACIVLISPENSKVGTKLSATLGMLFNVHTAKMDDEDLLSAAEKTVEEWPELKKCADSETIVDIILIPKKYADTIHQFLKKKMGIIRTPCGEKANQRVRGNASATIINIGTGCTGIIAIDSDTGMNEIEKLLLAPEKQKETNNTTSEKNNVAGKNEVVIQGIPEEEYAPVPVEKNAPYMYGGKNYSPICEGNFCVVLIPKKEIKEDICVNGQKLVPCAKGMNVRDLGKTVVVSKIVSDANSVSATYVAKGYEPVALDLNIPKGETYPKITGQYVVLDPDPLIRIHLNAYNGNIAVQNVEVRGASKIMQERIRFASCALHIGNISVSIDEKTHRAYVAFRVYDGDDPIYIPNVHVSVGAKDFTPQFDQTAMAYIAEMPVGNGLQKIGISARAEGCGEVNHIEEVYVGKSAASAMWAVLALITVVAVAVTLLRVVLR